MQPVTTGFAVTGYRLVRALKLALLIASLAVTLIGGFAVAHRVFGFQLRGSPASNLLITAFCFTLACVALLLWRPSAKSVFKRRVAQICGAFVALTGLLTLSQYFLGWDLRIDNIDKLHPGSQPGLQPGRMLFNNALCFTLSGWALIRLRPRTGGRSRIAEWLALTSGLVTLATIIGYLYGAPDFIAFFSFTGSAAGAALALFALNVGLLAAQEGGGVIASFVSRGPEGILARQLALGGGMALLALGFLTEWGEQALYLQPQAQKALLITAGIATMTLLVWRAMRAIARLDVTRSEAEAALRRSEERYRAVSELTSDYVYELHVAMDGETTLEEVTAAFTRITGFTLDEWQERGGLKNLIHPEDLPLAKQRLRRLLAGEADISEFRIITRDGEVRWLRDYGRAVWNEATGRVTRIPGAVQDITERKQAEEARRESEERLRLAAQAADFGTYDFNLITGAGYWSPELKVILGLSKKSENIFSLSQIIELLHPDDRERGEQAIQASADPLGSGDLVDERRILRPDGAVVWVMVKGKTFFAGQGAERRAVRANGTVLDITERKRAEAERERLYEQERTARAEAERMRAVAEAANRSKDEFLTMVSHELRSPLNAVLGYTRLLRSGPRDSAFVANAAAIVERNAKAQLRIVEDLLDSARIITGKLRLEAYPTDIVPVLEAALDVVLPAAESKGVELITHFSLLPEQVLGDADRLQQIVWNLLSNAVKFTPEGGRVEMRMESDDEGIRITVSDNGPGLEPEFLPYVFDRFRQADTSVTRRFGGLGLGLSLVKQLTELHGGTIEATSEGAGRGSTFTVTLPRLTMQPSFFAQSQSPALMTGEVRTENAIPLEEAPSLDGMLILIVDDQEEARVLLTLALSECGAQVMAVSSGLEALAILSDPPGGVQPDALILDIAMPDEDGYAVLQKVRALEAEMGVAQSEQIPAIALTAYGRSEDRMRALAAGFRMHVAKPVEPVELAIVIASLTTGRRKKQGASE